MVDTTVFGDADPEHLRRRAASFGAQAAAYAAERPDYPEDAISWALDPVAERTPLRVLDLGAGTGKLTAQLARRPLDVVAVEPDREMLEELRRGLPGITAMAGSAERIPLRDGSVDAVLVGQALHWFDLDRALPEMARVLRPGGIMAGIWNLDDDREPWVRGFKEAAQSTVSLKQWEPAAIPVDGVYFVAEDRRDFEHGQRRTAESLAATVGTHSHVLTLPPEERSRVLERVEKYLRATPETAQGEFTLPIVTVVTRFRRP